MEEALLAVVSTGAGDAARVHQQAEHGALHVDLHAAVNAVILEGADHLQAGAITDVGQARILMAAEVPLQNPPVLGAVEERAPRFEFAHAFRRFLGVQLRHAPVVEVLAATHGIGEMNAPVVAIVDVGQRSGNAALGHDGVGFAEQRFADHAYFGAAGRGFDRGAQSCPTCTDDQNIVGEPLELRHLQDSPVVPDAHGAEADVDVGESHPEQAGPRPLLVSPVQTAHAIVELVPYRVFRDAVERPSDQVPEGMAAEYISAEKDNIHDQDEASDADPEAVRETKGDDCVIDQKGPHQVGETQKVAMTHSLPYASRGAAPCPIHRENRGAHALMPPLRRTNRSSGSESGFYAAAQRITRDHLLRVRLSALAGPAVRRMMAAKASSRSDTPNRCRRSARRARSTSRPSAVHHATRP